MSVSLYSNSTHSYDDTQNRRPDYAPAIKKVVEYAKKHLDTRSTLADLCCGTGSITKRIADEVGGLERAVLIDINQNFIDIAKNSGIKAKNIALFSMSVLDANVMSKADVVLSVFAYHHFPNSEKKAYIEKMKLLLKPNGVLVLAEIYSPDKQATLAYYEKLSGNIPTDLQTPELKTFLDETARSEDFEFKVSKEYADRQFTDAGFSRVESTKIWPKDDTLSKDTGAFVEAWQISA